MTLAEYYCAEYLGKIFYYCLKKTGNEDDAGDLSSDISCAVLTALHNGTEPQSFENWVWKIASNRFRRWAKQHWYAPESDYAEIGEIAGALADTETDVEESLVLSEDLGLMRRELAFIRSDYRNILVAHYFRGKSVSMIAKEFGIPLGTVKTKLQNSRKKLREGMNMAREFGKRSYNPENIKYVKSGRDGDFGQPWTIVNHSMYKNIFLEVHENPETAEELSLELGIALPYMEDELEFLVREELLKKSGNKYETNFKIISYEEQKENREANLKIQKPLTDKLCELIDTYMNEDGAKVDVSFVGYETAKWTLLMRTFDWLKYDVEDKSEYGPYPARPDNGYWTLTGFESIDWNEPDSVGMHGCREKPNDIEENIEYYQFKYFYKDMYSRTPLFIDYREALVLWQIVNGKADECEPTYVKTMLEYGYIKEENGKLLPNVVVFDGQAENPCNADLTAKLTGLKNEIIDLFKQAPSIERGYAVEQALADGWLKYSDDLIPTAGAYIYR